MKFELEIKDLDKTVKALLKSSLEMRKAQAAALLQEAYAIDAESVPLVPVDTGRLRGSHFVWREGVRNLDFPEAIVGYGTDYAEAVHEIDRDYTVGQSKYLEQPYNARARGFDSRLAKRTWQNYLQKRGPGGVSTQGVPQKPEAGSETANDRRRAKARAQAKKQRKKR